MPANMANLLALIISTVLLVCGNAFLMTLLGLRLSIEGFSSGLIGLILVFYSLGFVLGTLYAGRIIETAGHIRAFAVFAAALAISVLLYPMAVETELWGFLRLLGGFSMAGLMIVVESWFSSQADRHNRAQLFAIYQVIFFLSTASGQLLIRVGDPAGFIPFSLAAILITLALVPLSITRSQAPVIDRADRLSLHALFRVSAVGTLGAMTAGLLISGFYTMGPVYANRIGLDLGQLSGFMASAIVAAMLLAWPVGRFCDRFNRYQVMLVAAIMAAVSSLGVALAGSFYMPLLIILVGLYMGISAALYPIAVAITNDLIDSHKITAASTTLLLSYGIGSCIGPLLSAAFMELLGPHGLFISNTAVLALFTLFLLKSSKPAPASTEQSETFHTTLPETALGLSVLDPRNPDFDPEHNMDDNHHFN